MAPGGSQCGLGPPKRARSHGVEDDVVSVAALGEIAGGVVDHPIGAQGRHQVDVSRTADSGDLRAEVFRQLYRVGADAPRRAVDQDPLPRADFRPVPKDVQRGCCPSTTAAASSEKMFGGFSANDPLSGITAYSALAPSLNPVNPKT